MATIDVNGISFVPLMPLFRKPVTPGDKLVYKVEAVHQVEDPVRPRAKFEGKAYVGEQLVAEAIMTAIGAKKEV